MTEQEVKLAHLRDDYEKLRTRELRAIRQQVQLLLLGREALKNLDLFVVDEFMERATDALLLELAHLEAAR